MSWLFGYPTEEILRAWAAGGQKGAPSVLECDGHDAPQSFLPEDPCEVCEYLAAHDIVGATSDLVGLRCYRHTRPVIVAREHGRAYDPEHSQADRQAIVNMLAWDEHDAQVVIGKDDFGHTNRLGHFRIHVVPGVPYGEMPEELSVALKNEAQAASRWFFPEQHPDFDYPAVFTRRPISDAEVRDRIQGYQYAIDREIARYTHHRFGSAWNDWRWRGDWKEQHRAWVNSFKEWSQTEIGKSALDFTNCHRIDLEALPWIVQRALVTRWELCWEPYMERFDSHVGFSEVPGCVIPEPAGNGRVAYFWFSDEEVRDDGRS